MATRVQKIGSERLADLAVMFLGDRRDGNAASRRSMTKRVRSARYSLRHGWSAPCLVPGHFDGRHAETVMSIVSIVEGGYDVVLNLCEFEVGFVLHLAKRFLLVVAVEAALSDEESVRLGLTAHSVDCPDGGSSSALSLSLCSDGRPQCRCCRQNKCEDRGQNQPLAKLFVDTRRSRQSLTESSTDHRHRHESSENITFEVGSEAHSLHNDQHNEQHRRNDEASQSTDEDLLQCVQEGTRDVLVVTPAPAELVKLDAEKGGAVELVSQHETPLGQGPLPLIDANYDVGHVGRKQSSIVNKVKVEADDGDARELDEAREGDSRPRLPAIGTRGGSRVGGEEGQDAEDEREVHEERDCCEAEESKKSLSVSCRVAIELERQRKVRLTHG